jgi:hypothetical protein
MYSHTVLLEGKISQHGSFIDLISVISLDSSGYNSINSLPFLVYSYTFRDLNINNQFLIWREASVGDTYMYIRSRTQTPHFVKGAVH